MATAPRDGTEIELKVTAPCERVIRAKWGTWKYHRAPADTYWCSAKAGWTLARFYEFAGWRPISANQAVR
jgi:hypothetical protein